jgi:hypothetical protein
MPQPYLPSSFGVFLAPYHRPDHDPALQLRRRPGAGGRTDPVPGPGRALLAAEACGLCGSDLGAVADPQLNAAARATHEYRMCEVNSGIPALRAALSDCYIPQVPSAAKPGGAGHDLACPSRRGPTAPVHTAPMPCRPADQRQPPSPNRNDPGVTVPPGRGRVPHPHHPLPNRRHR